MRREGPLELGRVDPAPHSVLRLLARPVGEPHDREPGQAVLEMGFDLDLASVEPDEGMGNGAREHRPTLRRKDARVCVESEPLCALARDQDVFEELAGAPAGPTVDVTAETLLETQPCALQDLDRGPAGR